MPQSSYNSLANIFIPDFRLLLDELSHERLALVVVEDDDLDAPLLEVRLAADERRVLADHDARHLVQDAGAGAHVARRERRVHRGAFVRGRGEAAGAL